MSGIFWNTLVNFSYIYDGSNKSCHELICISFLYFKSHVVSHVLSHVMSHLLSHVVSHVLSHVVSHVMSQSKSYVKSHSCKSHKLTHCHSLLF